MEWKKFGFAIFDEIFRNYIYDLLKKEGKLL
jgi:hypothetical protein